jgi:hypothetical protein
MTLMMKQFPDGTCGIHVDFPLAWPRGFHIFTGINAYKISDAFLSLLSCISDAHITNSIQYLHKLTVSLKGTVL